MRCWHEHGRRFGTDSGGCGCDGVVQFGSDGGRQVKITTTGGRTSPPSSRVADLLIKAARKKASSRKGKVA